MRVVTVVGRRFVVCDTDDDRRFLKGEVDRIHRLIYWRWTVGLNSAGMYAENVVPDYYAAKAAGVDLGTLDALVTETMDSLHPRRMEIPDGVDREAAWR